MGIFVSYPSNMFGSLAQIPTEIISVEEHPVWVTSLIVCNKGAAPIRFNLEKYRSQGVELKTACLVASTTAYTASYANGTAGVGATLTNTGTLAAFSVDGLSPTVNDRILIKDQTSAIQNGIYTVTTVGSGAVAWVLTRAADFNSPSTIEDGAVVPVTSGTVNANTLWNQTSTIVAVGTTPIVFAAQVNQNIFLINELSISPYSTIDVIDITGVIQLDYSTDPYIKDSLVCYSNGYTQVFDCDVNFTQLNDLPIV